MLSVTIGVGAALIFVLIAIICIFLAYNCSKRRDDNGAAFAIGAVILLIAAGACINSAINSARVLENIKVEDK